jgi:hypothetical protein
MTKVTFHLDATDRRPSSNIEMIDEGILAMSNLLLEPMKDMKRAVDTEVGSD